MSDNWNAIKEEVHTFRNYVHRMPPDAAKKASYCYLLPKEEIDRLLSLKGPEHLLHGLRIYLGAEMIEGHLVPNVHVVACEKDGEVYNDFGVPKSMPDVALGVETGVKPLAFSASAPGTGTDATSDAGKLKPCPTFCSTTNILNG